MGQPLLFPVGISRCSAPGLYYELLALGLQMCVTVKFLALLGGQLTTSALLAEGQQGYATSLACFSWALEACGVLSQHFKLKIERRTELENSGPNI